MKATIALARAAGQDAGNRNMKKHNRETWNEDDYNVACDTMQSVISTMDET